MFSELPHVADIVTSAFHSSANPLVLQITAFWVREVPCSPAAQQCHKIIQNRLAFVGEESVCVGHRRRAAAGSIRDLSTTEILAALAALGVAGAEERPDEPDVVHFVHLPESVSCYGASDYAVTEGGGDYTEHGVFAVDPLGTLYIIDWWRGQTAPDIWVDRQCDLILRHEPLCWFGEKGVIQKAVQPYLTHRMNERRAYCRVEWLPSVAEKTARARSFQALASMNKVMVPIEAPWKSELIGQLTRFPAGKYDDGVDVCSLIGRGLQMMPRPAAPNAREGRRRNRYFRSESDPYSYDREEGRYSSPERAADFWERGSGW